ncbi:MAG: magnesium transporter [Pseudomonadota bacterium]
MNHQHQTQEAFEIFSAAFQTGRLKSLQGMLNDLSPNHIAHLLESSPPKLRENLWTLIHEEHHGEIISHLNEDIQTDFLQGKNAQELAELTSNLDSDDIADILQHLPDAIIPQVLASMGKQNRQRIESIIHYDEDSAGGLMNLDTICIRPRLTLEVVHQYLRQLGDMPASTDSLFVINRRNQFVGLLPVSAILTSDPDKTVEELMDTDIKSIEASMSASETARLFERYDWISAPVVSTDGMLLGRITIDDIVDVIRDDADHSLLSMAGLDEYQDTFSPVIKTSLDRAIWLGLNLLTAFFAASTIKLFEDTIEKVVALAVLLPIVAGMGGVAGSQSLTVIIRGMALGQVVPQNRRWLMQREALAGLLNGLIWGIAAAAITALWFNDLNMALIIALAIIINLLVAALSGTYLPILFKRLNIDPALASSMALTTITDVVGFASFLGLATLFYG